jgi:hypothetical protein
MSQALDVIKVFHDVGCERQGLTVWMDRMHLAVHAAIAGGLKFDPDDFVMLLGRDYNRAWVGAGTLEGLYTRATGMQHRDHVKNQSAIIALEKYLKRPVYNLDGGRLFAGREIYMHHEWPSPHKGGWLSTWWEVTSFHDGESPYVNMVCRSVVEGIAGKRCKMTPEQCRDIEKARQGKAEVTSDHAT